MDKTLLIPFIATSLMFAATDPAKPAAAAGPVAAQSAFFEMYKTARTWAPDVLVLTMESVDIPEFKNEAGKAAAWKVVFVSPSRREARICTYSIADSGAIHKGPNIGNAQPWAPAPKVRPFAVNQFAVNSDVAFRTAAAKAADWIKANPNPAKKVKLYLSGETRFPTAAWYVMWGDQKAGYLAFVDATTGIVLNMK